MAELGTGLQVDVVRGRHAGKVGVVRGAHEVLPGFWWVALYMKTGTLGLPIVLSGGQLAPQQKGAARA